jgi:tetratricopeptide (TPR) repeat protein
MTERRLTVRDRIRAGRVARYLAMRGYDQALADYDRAIKLDATNPWAFVGRGDTYRAMECYEEALPGRPAALPVSAHRRGRPGRC